VWPWVGLQRRTLLIIVTHRPLRSNGFSYLWCRVFTGSLPSKGSLFWLSCRNGSIIINSENIIRTCGRHLPLRVMVRLCTFVKKLPHLNLNLEDIIKWSSLSVFWFLLSKSSLTKTVWHFRLTRTQQDKATVEIVSTNNTERISQDYIIRFQLQRSSGKLKFQDSFSTIQMGNTGYIRPLQCINISFNLHEFKKIFRPILQQQSVMLEVPVS
jgi:hypothetical protein